VPEDLHEDVGVEALGKENAGDGMPAVVEPVPRDATSLTEATEPT